MHRRAITATRISSDLSLNCMVIARRVVVACAEATDKRKFNTSEPYLANHEVPGAEVDRCDLKCPPAFHSAQRLFSASVDGQAA
jgi:hypothetical protein